MSRGYGYGPPQGYHYWSPHLPNHSSSLQRRVVYSQASSYPRSQPPPQPPSPRVRYFQQHPPVEADNQLWVEANARHEEQPAAPHIADMAPGSIPHQAPIYLSQQPPPIARQTLSPSTVHVQNKYDREILDATSSSTGTARSRSRPPRSTYGSRSDNDQCKEPQNTSNIEDMVADLRSEIADFQSAMAEVNANLVMLSILRQVFELVANELKKY